MSFEDLAMPLFPSLYGYARWLTGEAHEAEDLVQETYLKALRGFGSFRDGTNFRAWMFRILRNTFLTSRSGLRAMEPLDDDAAEEIAEEGTPETHFVNRANGEALRRAIEALPLPFREVLLLSDVENMRYKEIGEALGIPVGTVTSRLMRARRRVRAALEGMR
ncbi:MAG TPA: sigma-70 family RNA polymerase sigma factor [Thermoanaerobaculia bacterium]|nr:sigma-70 family RNA polymerase sigma factor [Thermoanaerobaculia bacterium]